MRNRTKVNSSNVYPVLPCILRLSYEMFIWSWKYFKQNMVLGQNLLPIKSLQQMSYLDM